MLTLIRCGGLIFVKKFLDPESGNIKPSILERQSGAGFIPVTAGREPDRFASFYS